MSADVHRQWVEELGIAHRAKAARRALLAAGGDAADAIRLGLHHRDPVVVVACCDLLDHTLDEAAIPHLVECTGHPDPEVRARALHALACDRCKDGACRPGEAMILEAANRALDDEHRRVRVQAVTALGPAVRRSTAAFDAVRARAVDDPHPGVRKIARWYLPGGPVYEGRRTKSGRRRAVPMDAVSSVRSV